MSAKATIRCQVTSWKSPIALTYSRIVEGVTESSEIFHVSDIEKTASYTSISEFGTVDHDMLNCQCTIMGRHTQHIQAGLLGLTSNYV